jgi:hypothetical protein
MFITHAEKAHLQDSVSSLIKAMAMLQKKVNEMQTDIQMLKVQLGRPLADPVAPVKKRGRPFGSKNKVTK